MRLCKLGRTQVPKAANYNFNSFWALLADYAEEVKIKMNHLDCKNWPDNKNKQDSKEGNDNNKMWWQGTATNGGDGKSKKGDSDSMSDGRGICMDGQGKTKSGKGKTKRDKAKGKGDERQGR